MSSKLQRSQRVEEEEEIPEKTAAKSLKKPSKPPRPPPRRSLAVSRSLSTATTSLTNGPSGKSLKNLKGSRYLRPVDRGAVNHAATFDETCTTSRRGANRIVAMNTIPGAIPDSFTRQNAIRGATIDLESFTLYNERTHLKVDQLGIIPEPSSRLYATTATAAFGGLIIGYDLEVISLILPRITHDLTLTSVGQQLSVSLTLGLAALSALLAGLLAERLGRRAVSLTSCVLYMSASLCMALSHNQQLLLAGRVLSGCSLGFISMATPVYLAELSPALTRGRLVTLFFIFLALGQLLADVVNACLLGASHGWRIMLGLGMLPAFIHLVTVSLMPETPHWLVQHGRLQDAKQVLERMRKKPEVAEELDRIRQACEDAEVVHVQTGEPPALWQMLSTPWVRRALLMGCSLHVIQQSTGFSVIRNSNILVIKMAAMFDDVTASWLACVPGAIFFLSVFVGLYLVEKVGRRPLTLASILGIVVSLSWLAVGYQLSTIYSASVSSHDSVSSTGPCNTFRTCNSCIQDAHCGFCFSSSSNGSITGSCSSLPPDGAIVNTMDACNATSQTAVLARDYCPSHLFWMPLVGVLVYYIFLGSGIGPLAWTINPEIYPVWARCTGVAVATSASWLCNLIVTLTYPALVDNITIYGTLWIYACLVLAGLVFLWFFLPETKEKPLEETEGAFAHAWCGEDAPSIKEPAETVQYVHIRGLNRDGQDSEDIESPE